MRKSVATVRTSGCSNIDEILHVISNSPDVLHPVLHSLVAIPLHIGVFKETFHPLKFIPEPSQLFIHILQEQSFFDEKVADFFQEVAHDGFSHFRFCEILNWRDLADILSAAKRPFVIDPTPCLARRQRQEIGCEYKAGSSQEDSFFDSSSSDRFVG